MEVSEGSRGMKLFKVTKVVYHLTPASTTRIHEWFDGLYPMVMFVAEESEDEFRG